MRFSIAMATYNGERFIKEQLESILQDISLDDEVIISDDGSSDNTISIIEQYIMKYPNIRLIKGPRKGVFCNFENAIANCNNEIICLSDQDDIWIKGKRELLQQAFSNKEINLVLHNANMFNENGEYLYSFIHKRNGVFVNTLRSCYWGCCMAFRRDFIHKYIPFGFSGIAHDQLIGLLAEKDKSSYFLDKVLIKHRVHGNNVSSPKNIITKISNRIKLTNDYFCAVKNSKGKVKQ